MTTGFQNSSGVDFDSLFDPYVQGTKPAATGKQTSDGVDLNQRFAPIDYGTMIASNTGHQISSGADCRTLWAAKDSAFYGSMPNGSYSAAAGAFTNQSTALAVLQVSYKGDGTWKITRRANTGSEVIIVSGQWATPTPADYTATLTLSNIVSSAPSHTSYSGGGTVVGGSADVVYATLNADSPGTNAVDNTIDADLTIVIKKAASGAVVKSVVIHINADAVGYV